MLKNRFMRHAATIALTAGVAFTGAALAGGDGLTTFDEYARMKPKQQDTVRSKALGTIYGQAKDQKDVTRAVCILDTYLNGPKDLVAKEHAQLRARLEAGIESHSDDGRVEFSVENHINGKCPRTGRVASL